jgi:hypothetical protein
VTTAFPWSAPAFTALAAFATAAAATEASEAFASSSTAVAAALVEAAGAVVTMMTVMSMGAGTTVRDLPGGSIASLLAVFHLGVLLACGGSAIILGGGLLFGICRCAGLGFVLRRCGRRSTAEAGEEGVVLALFLERGDEVPEGSGLVEVTYGRHTCVVTRLTFL